MGTYLDPLVLSLQLSKNYIYQEAKCYYYITTFEVKTNFDQKKKKRHLNNTYCWHISILLFFFFYFKLNCSFPKYNWITIIWIVTISISLFRIWLNTTQLNKFCSGHQTSRIIFIGIRAVKFIRFITERLIYDLLQLRRNK